MCIKEGNDIMSSVCLMGGGGDGEGAGKGLAREVIPAVSGDPSKGSAGSRPGRYQDRSLPSPTPGPSLPLASLGATLEVTAHASLIFSINNNIEQMEWSFNYS